MAAKRLLYLTDQHLAAYIYEHGQVVQQAQFADDAGGYQEFAALLRDRPDLPVYLLTDLAEEDYRQETIPHVTGRDRTALLKRKLNQFYRGTPFRHSVLQGRETHGRQDDKILVSALTNADNLKPWAEIIREAGATLAGIYSVALVTRLLVKKLGLNNPHQLILTQQQAGLRQSYFQGQDIKFSRLTRVLESGPEALARTVLNESSRAQQYLSSLRLLPRDATLSIVVIGHQTSLRAMQQSIQDAGQLHYQFIDIADVARAIGIRHFVGDMHGDSLFLHLLARAGLANQYAPAESLRVFKLRQWRQAMQAASVVVVVVALAVAIGHLWQAVGHMQRSGQIQAEIAESRRQYAEITKTFPATPISADSVKIIVGVADAVAENNLPNRKLLTAISQVLDNLPKKIQLQKLRWLYSAEPDAIKGDNTPATTALPETSGKSGKQSLVAVLGGEIEVSNYGEAVIWLNALSAGLEKTGAEVTTLKLPLDTRPQSSLQGSTDDGAGKIKSAFQLKMVWKPQP